MPDPTKDCAEVMRLKEDATRIKNWKRWGPYISERQWGTVREDYSDNGDCWDYFTHDQARSRAYRWGEDGLLGICDRECRLCFAVALWNGKDPILKERLFGLTGPEGNHGEDVKEEYFFLDCTPTHSYMKALYKYPQREFPYAWLVDENRRRTRNDPEFELPDTGAFDESRYFDVIAEYAKGGPDDILIRITIKNWGPERAVLDVLPTVWFRNTWSWGSSDEAGIEKPFLGASGGGGIACKHETLGDFMFAIDPANAGQKPELLFAENETNQARLFNDPESPAYCKDAFHDYVVHGRKYAVNPQQTGTKAAARYHLEIEPGAQTTLRFRLSAKNAAASRAFGPAFDAIFSQRLAEADAFYAEHIPVALSADQKNVARQAYAGLLWSKQFYQMIVETWLKGDPLQPPPPPGHMRGRNADWPHLFSRDVLSMPDTWEYPWFAAWDLAFHMITMASVDPYFAKEQLLLLLREWYMHPNGQIPAYEFSFSDVNPPVHAWACWRVYKMTGPRGQRDRLFLERAFQKLMINFTWWVNRKDINGRHIFAGGFLGLDNIGIFDRSKALPGGARLDQADGTAWMAFYCSTMLAIALELASQDPAYEDIASKFFEHFVHIVDAINTLGGNGLWNDDDGFYYDQLCTDDHTTPLKIRSTVGLLPMIACEVLERDIIDKLPGFSKRMQWFLKHRPDLSKHIAYMESSGVDRGDHYLLAIPSRQRLTRMLKYVLDEKEFLSPYGLRSISRIHLEHPFCLQADGQQLSVQYEPGESRTSLFGGNSNWRGPIWFPVNFLAIEALERYHHFYGDDLRTECPIGSGKFITLQEVAHFLRQRMAALFLKDASGKRPCFGDDPRFAAAPDWRDLLQFHEYFHGDTGRGLGASHQTGWTALVAKCLEDIGKCAEDPDEITPAVPEKRDE
jgi:hypothetical protein